MNYYNSNMSNFYYCIIILYYYLNVNIFECNLELKNKSILKSEFFHKNNFSKIVNA